MGRCARQAVIATISLTDFLKNWKVAALTAPFVLVTGLSCWPVTVSSVSKASVCGAGTAGSVCGTDRGIPYSDLIPDIFRGVSEVFLLSSITVGILFVIGLAVSSVWAAVFAVFGSLLAFGVASF